MGNSVDSFTYLSHDWPTHSNPPPQQRQQGYLYLETLRRNPPGAWGDNRYQQVQHYKGVIYVAIRSVMSLAGGATYQALKRKKPSRGRTTFTKAHVVKAVAVPGQGQDEDYIPIDDDAHPVAHMLTYPNETETMGELTAKLILQNRLTGVGPLWAVPNKDGKPVELWALKSATMYPLWQASKIYPNGAWQIRPQIAPGWAGGMPYGMSLAGAILPGEEVKRFLEPSPLIDWDGYSPLTAGAIHLDVLEAINESRKTAMDVGLNLDVVAILPGMEQASLDRLTAKMNEKAGGAANHRKFLAFAPPVGQGPQDKSALQTFGQSPKEMDYTNSYEQETRFALALFRVPATVAGLVSPSSYSELYAARQQMHDSQEDYFGDISTFYTRSLAWPWCSFPGEYRIRCKLPPVNDKELAEKQIATDINIRTVNERRAQRDMPSVGPEGDVPEAIYIKVLEDKHVPKPAPKPNPFGGGGNPFGGKPGGDTSAPLPVDTPHAGKVPSPDNPESEGTGLPQVNKSADGMSSLVGSAGGFLVPPKTSGAKVKTRAYSRRRKMGQRYVGKILKALGEE